MLQRRVARLGVRWTAALPVVVSSTRFDSSTHRLYAHNNFFGAYLSQPISTLTSTSATDSLRQRTRPTHHWLPQTRLFSSKPDFEKEFQNKHFDFQSMESSIYKWWEENSYFQPTTRSDVVEQKKFVLPMPPPNVTGYLHMGHAIFLALQDIMARYHRMKGDETLWIPGTDHAGIATQLLVERQLKAEGLSRSALGREKFLERVWQWKEEKGGYITQQMKRLGASADWTRERFTLSPSMNSAVTEAFVRLYEQGLIYRGDYMINWSPNLQTAVSDLEVDYAEEEGQLYTFKYMLADSTDGEYIPVATTRPETILGDTAVCVHPTDERFAKFIGQMVTVPFVNRRIPVIADDYVDPTFGTGALKITPAHDINDYTLAKRHNLPLINIFHKDATVNDIGGASYEGLDRFVCREKLWNDLTKLDLTIKVEKHMQRVPRSQRGGEVIEPMVSTQWFVRMQSMADQAVNAVREKELTIIPERFEKVWFQWLENIHDWCISRQLWWGHRIPVYYVKSSASDKPAFFVARSEEEAYTLARAQYGHDVELEQDEDVLDTWFSSGLWPFATLGWPNKEAIDNPHSDLNRFYPGDVLETGYDILFFWVARMVTLGYGLTGRLPFHTIYLHGLVRDAQGQKMSKTKGNVLDPIEAIDQFGADALRFALIVSSAAGQDVPLSMERVEANRNFVNKLWNIGKYTQHALQSVSLSTQELSFVAQSIDRLMTAEELESLPLAERYIVSRAHALMKSVTHDLDSYKFADAARSIYEFLWDDLADWFVEMSKCHVRDGLQSQQRQQSLQTLRVLLYVWDISLRLLHPFMPFVTETLWQALPQQQQSQGSASVMMSQWPCDLSNGNHDCEAYVDMESIKAFERLQKLVRGIRNARVEHSVDPNRRISCIVQSSSQSFLHALQTQEQSSLVMLAKLDSTQLHLWNSSAESKPVDMSAQFASMGPLVHIVVDDICEVFLPQSGLLDATKERARLTKQLEKLQKDLLSLESRLGNEQFLAKAPAHLVADMQQKMSETQQQVSTVQSTLESLPQ